MTLNPDESALSPLAVEVREATDDVIRLARGTYADNRFAEAALRSALDLQNVFRLGVVDRQLAGSLFAFAKNVSDLEQWDEREFTHAIARMGYQGSKWLRDAFPSKGLLARLFSLWRS